MSKIIAWIGNFAKNEWSRHEGSIEQAREYIAENGGVMVISQNKPTVPPSFI
jgi:hypothetical protein